MNKLDLLTKLLNETPEVIRFKALEEKVLNNDYLKGLYDELHEVSKNLTNCKHLGLEEASSQAQKRYDEIVKILSEDVLFCEYNNALSDVKNILNIITESLEIKLDNYLNE